MIQEDKILLLMDNIKDVEKYKKLGVTNFLFALKDYSVGYKSFSFEELNHLNENVYILANRILTDEDLDDFDTLKIPKCIKGFIIEDLGLYMTLRDKDYTLINFQNHLNNNYKSVNYYLNYFDSLVLNNDITLEEIKKIIEQTQKPLWLQVFTRQMIMYSRRNLISNYNKYYDLDKNSYNRLDISYNDRNFIVKENKYGTAIFNKSVTDLRFVLDSLNKDNVLFYIIDSQFIDNYNEFINGKKYDFTTNGFLYNRTVYRIGDLD